MIIVNTLKKAFWKRWQSAGALYLSLAVGLWIPISLAYHEALELPLPATELISVSGEFHQTSLQGGYSYVYRIKTNDGNWRTFECGFGRGAGCPPTAFPIVKGSQVTVVYHARHPRLLLELSTKEGSALELSKMISQYQLNPTTKPIMYISGLFFVLFLLTPILHKEK